MSYYLIRKSILKEALEPIRLVCFILAWFSSVSLIVWNSDTNIFAYYGSFLFIFFLILTLPLIKLQSVIIILFLVLLLYNVTEKFPSQNDLFDSFRYILIFAGLIPTMGLVRSTGLRLESVKEAQKRLSKLPENHMTTGFQLTAHFFGALINTGVFAMLAATLPKESSSNYRKSAAEAALRGMASSATWSPFFVAFVIGQIYIDSFSAWIALALGLGTALLFSTCSVIALNRRSVLQNVIISGTCLTPILPILALIMFSVVAAATLFELTALSAIIIIMPSLVSTYFCYKPNQVKSILSETIIYLKSSKDDVLVISFAMIVGSLITNNLEALDNISGMKIFDIPTCSVLVFIPVSMASLSLIGIHPIISSTILLSIFTNPEFQINSALIMQAHLIGWCTGTMSSISSLSVITCSRLFDINSSKLCFGKNALVSLIFAITGGTLLSIIGLFS